MPGGNGSGFTTHEPDPDEEPDLGDEAGQNKATVRQYFEQVWNQGRLELVDSLVAESYVRHQAGMLRRGPEKLKRYVQERRATVPDLHVEIHDMLAEEDNVAVRVLVSGTDKADTAGEERMTTGIAIFRLDGGQIVESWHTFDPPRPRQATSGSAGA